ncbi:MAG: SDR family oxidoreductase [Planctomycetaceae bacterium]|nr:SDR family oxidoreductase [Planctomycetales bacterium]MCB9923361.1 SDR family oxidoreductase [Planctomycetaceae bacterium]
MNQNRPRGSVRYDNSGRIAIVSGGCSGIGLAICEAFVRTNAAGVVCLDIAEDRVGDLPEGVEFIRCDTSQDEQCREAIAWSVDRFGAVDVLVNNAAIQPQDSYVPLHQLPVDVWNRLIAINFSGYTFLAKFALQQMQQQHSGVVVNIASGQGHRTARQVGAYGPIKAGNIMQARQWGIEYARDGIRVVSVSPGAIDTPMVRASLSQQGGEAVIANRHPIGRLGRPEEVANAVLWLSSEDAAFITGTDLEVDGGLGAFAAFANPYPMPNR